MYYKLYQSLVRRLIYKCAEKTNYMFMSREQMQGNIIGKREKIINFELWNTSNIWEQTQQTKLAFMKSGEGE